MPTALSPQASRLSRGSEWRKWDLHIHSPLSALNNQFVKNQDSTADWEAYISALEKVTDIPAIAITDYFGIEGYKKVREFKSQGRLQNFRLILPNIEFRIDKIIATNKGQRRLNYHVIFSDEISPEHIEAHFLQEIKFCYESDPQNLDLSWPVRRENLELLGSRLKKEHAPFEGKSDYEIGCMNATVEPARIKQVLLEKERIFKGKYLIVLPEEHLALLDWDGQDHQTRKVLLQGADAIFSRNSKTIKWALGEHHGKEDFIKEFKSLKPCVAGSDAHRLEDLAQPVDGRFFWVKAQTSFEGLKQILFEPRERVFIGDKPPKLKHDYQIIESISLEGSPDWFGKITIPLNADMVSVIGPRGSGKSALSELIAFAGGATLFKGKEPLSDTFIFKASKKSFVNPNPISGIKATLHWREGEPDAVQLGPDLRTTGREEKVKYLPQKFVERLCAPENNQELEHEIERVIFQRNKKTERLQASNFEELRRASTATIQTKRQRLGLTIKSLNQSIADTAARITQKSVKQLEQRRKEQELATLQKDAPTVPPENQHEIRQLEALEAERQRLETLIVALNEQQAAVDAILVKYEVMQTDIATFNREVGELLAKAGFEDADAVFRIAVPEVASALQDRRSAILETTQALREPTKEMSGETENVTLASVDAKIRAIKETSRLTEVKRREYEKFQQDKQKLEEAIAALKADLVQIDQILAPKLRADQEQLLERYIDALELIKQERSVLEKLYEPLKNALSKSNETARKLSFFSKTTFDSMNHASRGMELFDRRKSTFKDEEQLEVSLNEFFEKLQAADFDRQTVKDSIQALQSSIISPDHPVKDQLRKDRSAKDFADWLYDIEPFSVSYALKFDNKDLHYLSPGEKGIVLLLLYLEAEEDDNRPLLIDQPDDNLDNLSVYPNLIEYFRDRKRTRQIVIITHNPNLVVTTDTEQVIVAGFDGTRTPKIVYRSGALEDTSPATNAGIREEVCKVLEGGIEAFQVRENRYAIGRTA
jgi:hypothetical protein